MAATTASAMPRTPQSHSTRQGPARGVLPAPNSLPTTAAGQRAQHCATKDRETDHRDRLAARSTIAVGLAAGLAAVACRYRRQPTLPLSAARITDSVSMPASNTLLTMRLASGGL